MTCSAAFQLLEASLVLVHTRMMAPFELRKAELVFIFIADTIQELTDHLHL